MNPNPTKTVHVLVSPNLMPICVFDAEGDANKECERLNKDKDALHRCFVIDRVLYPASYLQGMP